MIDWSSQPDVALSGVGGHSVHGLEGPGVHTHRSMVVDGFGLRSGRDEQKVMNISRLGFS